MNTAKLIQYNMSKPLELRVSSERVKSLERTARTRGNQAALRAQVEQEIALQPAQPSATIKGEWN